MRFDPALRPLAVVAVLAGLALARPAAAQSPPPPAGSPAAAAPAPVKVAPDSPRASVTAYLNAAREGRWADAARYLDVPAARTSEAQPLARRLKAVLDRHLWIDLESVSPLSEGAMDDGLPANVEELGRIPGGKGSPEPVYLVRRQVGDRIAWVFSGATVERVDGWYDALRGSWLHQRLPEVLLRPGPHDLLWWQWLALPLLVLITWPLGRLCGWITRRALGHVFARTKATWDDQLLLRVGPPLTVAWSILLLYLTVPLLALYKPAEAFVHAGLRAAFFIVIFWALLRSIDVGAQLILESPLTAARPALRGLVPLGSRIAKVVVVAIAAVSVLSQLGYPVASLLAGLGLGGLALALAAQKTVENLFGSVSIGVDQPFREGDFVKVGDILGTVENVGLRSTRIRSLDRTLITLPNGQLADMRIENYSVRDRIRMYAQIGVVYDTTVDQMRQVLANLEAVLRAHPKIWPDNVVVRFAGFGASSLDIDVMAWFLTGDWGEFQLIRQDVYLQFIEAVERAGSSFAFPTRTVHVVNGEGGPATEAGASPRAATLS